MPLFRSSFDLPVAPDAPATARRLVTLLLQQWALADEDARDSTLLVLSELVTNAVQHAGEAPVHVSVELHEAEVVVAVVDPSPAIPRQRASEGDEESGRGLAIIDAVARRWGVEPGPEAAGKRVYAVLALEPARCA